MNPSERGEERPWNLAPGTQVAGFTVEGLLASGSFGTVYRAVRGGKSFAIKLVWRDARSEREVDALRRVPQHPNVVGFHGYGLWPDDNPRFLVLALQLVEGPALDVWVREHNPTALEWVDQVLLPLALTLAEVHAAGVVHRDVKEANILMREEDGQPVLVDFGAAVYEGAPRLTQRLPPGTAEYRSPELLRFAQEWEGEYYPAQPQDDLWALGVTAYVLLTGTLPFGERNDPGMMRAILEERPVPPHERNPRVPRALSDVCMRMLEKDPSARYADGEALAEALEEEVDTAGDSWNVPLFPASERTAQQPPAVPRTPASRWWLSGLVLAASLGAFFVLVQRAGSLPPFPSQQASFRQELASSGVTGEVVHGAGPPRSLTPAPVAPATNNEVPLMKKSQTSRTVLVATCILGSACASGPQRRPPGPAECPLGAAATHERFGMGVYHAHGALFPPYEKIGIVPVKQGDIITESIGQWGTLPDATHFSGRVFFGKDRVYARFTQARLPNGAVLPICLEMTRNADQGVPMEAGSTSDTALIDSTVSVEPVIRFE